MPPVDVKPNRKARVSRACERCRLKKYKCDESVPCLRCQKSQFKCVYQPTKRQQEEDAMPSFARIHELNSQIRLLTKRLFEAEASLSQGRPRPSRLESNISTVDQRTVNVVNGANISTGDAAYTPESYQIKEEPVSTTEITDLNKYTNAVEFHGSSSSVVILGQVHDDCDKLLQQFGSSAEKAHSLITALHNPDFTAQATNSPQEINNYSGEADLYFPQAATFITSYFDTLHHIHPIVDKDHFNQRATDLWQGRPCNSSFVALYYSIMSLGALVGVWIDEKQMLRMTRFEWSRKLFREAQVCLDESKFSSDLDTVQCLFSMARICQHELNPHLGYMYLGQAVRTCLSAGFNRQTASASTLEAETISKTWWAIYSFEIEMAFSLGRPDTLGMDEYHTRQLPEITESESAIIPYMIDFSQIARSVSTRIYSSRAPWQEKIHTALSIQKELDDWIDGLPTTIKPDTTIEGRFSQMVLREPNWSRRQRLIMRLRYYNMKALLFRPFLSQAIQSSTPVNPELVKAVWKCTGSARKTIEIIHETLRIHDFFRTWWYNTTYIIFAASVLLLHLLRLRSSITSEMVNTNIKVVEMAIGLLEAMDESVVARRAAELIKQSLSVVKGATVLESGPTSVTIEHPQFYPFGPENLEQEFNDDTLFPGMGFQDYFPQDMTHAFGGPWTGSS